MFDNDEPGQQAAKSCVDLFKPGQCKIARLPLKDASDMLQAGRGDEIIKAMWDAPVARPDGIVSGVDLWETVIAQDPHPGLPYPWPSLNTAILGMRRGELVTICAGSGIGKSTYCRELAHYLMRNGQTVGYIALEENNRKTALGLMGIELNKRLTVSREGVTNDDLKRAFQATVGSGLCYMYDHFGSCDVDNLLNRIRYLAKGCNCNWIVLDHLSIVVSGLGDGDERKLIDLAMTKLRSLVEETGIGMLLVSHLKRPPEGKSYNEGRHISLSDLRGSAGIEQLSDTVLGIERNQQDPENKHLSCIRVLKDRTTGYTGTGCDLRFDSATGRLHDAEQSLGEY
jgi:twinkle protein